MTISEHQRREKEIKNKLKYWVPQSFLDMKEYLGALHLLQRIGKDVLERNKRLHNKYQNQTVYILANGPSLNNFDLNQIRDTCVITMNHFERHPAKDRFKIVAHCIGEPFASTTWEDPYPMINNISAETFWFNIDAYYFFRQGLPDNYHLYSPGIAPRMRYLEGKDLGTVALRYQSAAQMAIMIAIYLGFDRIYLLGFDHDWLVSREHSTHFYEETEDLPKADLAIFSYREKIEMSLNLFLIYERIRCLADKEGIRIINLSRPSYLDIFSRT